MTSMKKKIWFTWKKINSFNFIESWLEIKLNMFSIIIPTFNEAGQITDTIDKIKAAKGGHEIEIIVVDGNSTDNTLIWQIVVVPQL